MANSDAYPAEGVTDRKTAVGVLNEAADALEFIAKFLTREIDDAKAVLAEDMAFAGEENVDGHFISLLIRPAHADKLIETLRIAVDNVRLIAAAPINQSKENCNEQQQTTVTWVTVGNSEVVTSSRRRPSGR
jgi:hypothetical protein